MRAGTFSACDLRQLIQSGAILAPTPLDPAQVQPGSVDLRLGDEGYRMPGSVLALPGETVRELIDGLALERIDLQQPRLLGRNQVYLVRLQEGLRLPAEVSAYTNSKSSTGRLDLATRVLSDGAPRYDRINTGYHGELWVELIPRSFDILARHGDSLNQAIFFAQRQILDACQLAARYAQQPLLYDQGGAVAAERCLYDGRVVMGAELATATVGWVARRAHRPIDLARLAGHRPADYFQRLSRPESGYLFLEKNRFYILASRERVLVPPDLACEMVPYDPSAGEFRAHYAGFFDPGWGASDGRRPGRRAVLEVRPHEDDLILRHGQPICAMAYERLRDATDLPYGSGGNSYAEQDGPQLSKHFAPDSPPA